MKPHFCDAFFSEAICFHEPQNDIVHILDKIQLFGFVFEMSNTVIMVDASVNSECIRRRKPSRGRMLLMRVHYLLVFSKFVGHCYTTSMLFRRNAACAIVAQG